MPAAAGVVQPAWPCGALLHPPLPINPTPPQHPSQHDEPHAPVVGRSLGHLRLGSARGKRLTAAMCACWCRCCSQLECCRCLVMTVPSAQQLRWEASQPVGHAGAAWAGRQREERRVEPGCHSVGAVQRWVGGWWLGLLGHVVRLPAWAAAGPEQLLCRGGRGRDQSNQRAALALPLALYHGSTAPFPSHVLQAFARAAASSRRCGCPRTAPQRWRRCRWGGRIGRLNSRTD